jgi:hypothetical protein
VVVKDNHELLKEQKKMEKEKKKNPHLFLGKPDPDPMLGKQNSDLLFYVFSNRMMINGKNSELEVEVWKWH